MGGPRTWLANFSRVHANISDNSEKFINVWKPELTGSIFLIILMKSEYSLQVEAPGSCLAYLPLNLALHWTSYEEGSGLGLLPMAVLGDNNAQP